MSLVARPDLLAAQRVLCCQPHYDDNDIGAGGTIAALVEAGAEVFYLTVTDDLIGVIDDSLTEAEAAALLKREQAEAGDLIGVSGQFWLGYPDADKYDYYDVRRDIIRHIRMLRPDFILTVDPYLPYEAHQDHILTGKAVSEAAILYGMMRLKTDPEVDAAYETHDIQGIGYYLTHAPNTFVDIHHTHVKKHAAVGAYHAQFTDEDMALLQYYLDLKEQEYGMAHGCKYAEALKVLHIRHLHSSVDAGRA
ncbi:MAG TPA: PIG-L deacetylase family protein [Levilinea sp.]|nr:PIG-L deacetylase family protein [Levilinea sp.]